MHRFSDRRRHNLASQKCGRGWTDDATSPDGAGVASTARRWFPPVSDVTARPEDWIRIGAAAAALGVSVDTLRRWERDGRIQFERRGQQRYLRADELAALLRERAREGRSSARNRPQGIVLNVRRDGVMAQIDMACGPYRIVSLMSREAADDLGIKPGDQAVALIKSTTVVVEKR